MSEIVSTVYIKITMWNRKECVKIEPLLKQDF